MRALCRSITHPPLANERVQCKAARVVVRKLKTPEAMHLVMYALLFMHGWLHWCHRRAIHASARFPSVRDSFVEPNRAACGTAMGREREAEDS